MLRKQELTGAKDLKGNQIKEGDRLLIEMEDEYIQGDVYWNSEYYCYQVGNHKIHLCQDDYLWEWESENCVIVGNIYEGCNCE